MRLLRHKAPHRACFARNDVRFVCAVPPLERHCEARSSLFFNARYQWMRLLRHNAPHRACFARNDVRFSMPSTLTRLMSTRDKPRPRILTSRFFVHSDCWNANQVTGRQQVGRPAPGSSTSGNVSSTLNKPYILKSLFLLNPVPFLS